MDDDDDDNDDDDDIMMRMIIVMEREGIILIYLKKARRKDPDELKYKTKWTHEMVSYNIDYEYDHVDKNDDGDDSDGEY